LPDATPASASPASALRFGAAGRFELQPAERRLLVDGQPANLGARALDLLIALAAQPDHLLTKNELLDRVWPGLVVEEANLQVQIGNLRRLLGSDVVATVPGRGYRFTAKVDGAVAAPIGAAAQTLPGAPAQTNLPAEQQPLYGRDDDVALVCRLVEAHRLVSIVGAGGIGKTRVAQAAADGLLGEHPDGVWLIELAPLADPALLPSSVAQALGLQLQGRQPPLDELVTALQSQRLLLLLDNCEHLLEAISLLAQALLARTLGVRMLVTSQEPLRVRGEHQYRLGPLGVPSAAEASDPHAALEFGAVRLFVERVQGLDPRFALDAQKAVAVADICRHLDGLALAIELAAARVPLLGVEGVSDRLGERLRVLTAGSRIALRRHQTLRAALDWSHGLLGPDERTVFRRLGVFSGGCTVEAAQQVSGDEQLDEWAVLDHLGALVDKSLVVADGEDRPRYRLLESARAYALEKLAETGETDVLARRHAAFYAARFERLAEAWYSSRLSEDAYIAARAADLENVRSAVTWSLGAHGDTDVALALLVHTAPVSLILPMHEESERWCKALSQRLAGNPPSNTQAAWNIYLQVHWRMLRLRAIVRGREAMHVEADTLEHLGDARRQAHALCIVALHSTWIGDVPTASSAIEAAARLDQSGWPSWLWALHLQIRIRVQHMAGESLSMASELRVALQRLEAAGEGDGRSAFVMRTDLAVDDLAQEHFEEARRRLEALADQGRRQRRDPHRMSVLMAHWALALAELDRPAEARAVVLEGLPHLQRTGLWGVYAPVIALVAATSGNTQSAAHWLGAGNAQLVRSGLCRSLIERRAELHLMTLLEAAHPKTQIDAWMAEGAALADEISAQLPMVLT
jgi:predicted ATPase/DNA-binding winged helix-turn-helix (wHTH) protein